MSAVAFIHRSAKPGQSRIEVVASEPAMLVTVDRAGTVDVHVAADTPAEADAFVDELEQREDVGAAVRTLIDASEARPT